MGTEWMLIIALFLISAFVTYGIFANVEDARREARSLAQPATGRDGRLAAKLADEIAAIRCDLTGVTREDAPALEALRAQELELAEIAEKRGLLKEAEIHRSIAGSVASHLEGFDEAAKSA